MKHIKDNNFWLCLDELLAQSKIVIDRPKDMESVQSLLLSLVLGG